MLKDSGSLLSMRGFTLMETLVTLALLLLVTAGIFAVSGEFNSQREVYYYALRVKAELNEQYSKAIEGTAFDKSVPLKFGICFEKDRYSLFATTSVWSERLAGYTETVSLPEGLFFDNFDFLNSCQGGKNNCVIFFPITGGVEKAGSVVLVSDATSNRYRIAVGDGGLVELERL